MIDRARALLNRPISERHRRVVFAAAVSVILAAAVLLLVTRPDGGGEPAASAPPPASTAAPPEPVPANPADLQEVPAAPPGTPQANAPFRPSAAAERAMRRFLEGYLGYLYGQERAQRIEGASRTLVRRLAANPPRVSPAQRDRRPRVVEVRARKPQDGRVRLVATIDDGGVSRYPISAVVVRRDGGWQVADVLDDE